MTLFRAKIMKKSIRKPYDDVVCVPCSHSVNIEPIYQLKRDDNSNSVYIRVGERNINEYINSFGNMASLSSILSRISFMPINEKVNYLNMVDSGVSGDISNIPTDATAAAIFLEKYSTILPKISKDLKSGMSITDVINSYVVPKKDNTPKNDIVKDGENNVKA